MINIKDLADYLWVPCPKCGFGVLVKEWGEQTCGYMGCDGHKFMFEYNLQNAEVLLKELQRRADLRKNIKPLPMKRPAAPIIQPVCNGWIAVPQPDTEDPRKWYHADQVLFKEYMAEYLATAK